MPDSVKISELTPRTALEGDVLPAVDSTFSATVRVTAGSIAAIGGGPPADNSVSTEKIQNGAVTYPKIQNVTADRVLGRTSSAAGVIEEIPCTPLARDLLAAATPLEARDVIDALAGMDNPDFRGQVRLQRGTAAAPSLSMGDYTDPNQANWIEDLDTGLYFPQENVVGISTRGTLKWYIDSEGNQFSVVPGSDVVTAAQMMPHLSARAWVAIDGSAGASTTMRNQALIAQRYGLTNSIWNDGFNPNGSTVAKIIALEAALGNTVSHVGTIAADGRSNYTSPGNDKHWAWNPVTSQWYQVAASGRNWIGNIVFTATNNQPILESVNVSSVTLRGAGQYRINFVNPMPDTNYVVLISSFRTFTTASGGDRINARATTYVDIDHFVGSTPTSEGYIAVAIFR
jgi:hypothetical protein